MARKYHLSGYTSGRQKPLGKDGPDWLGHCRVHDKTAWASRKAARRAAKKRHPEGGKAPYPCRITNGWHYGTAHYSRDTYRGIGNVTENPGREMDQGYNEPEQPGQLGSAESSSGIPDQ